MSIKLAEIFKAAPVAPPVVLLPDDRFFVRVLPVTPTATAEEVATQVELALETISPFPPAQLYYGYYWVAGADTVLVFACYRKRFSSDQTSSWNSSRIVLPTFAAVLGLEHKPATTVVIPSPGLLTAVHWAAGKVPSAIATRTLAPDITEADQAKAKDELIRSVGESAHVVTLAGTPEADLSDDEKNFIFTAGEIETELPVEASAPLDVRDKAELDLLRKNRSRDLVIWRVFMGCAAALVLLGLAEIGLYAAKKAWLPSMDAVMTKQKPIVASIKDAYDLSEFIQNLSDRPVLPFEMVSAIHPQNPAIKSDRVSFTSVVVAKNAINDLVVRASAPTPQDLDAYLSAVKQQPGVAEVKQGQMTNNGGRGAAGSTVQFTVVFKPGFLKPASG